MTKKSKIILIISLTVIGITSIGLLTYYFTKPKIVNKVNTNKYVVTVDGAVKKPGDYHFDKPKTLREILFEASLLTNADISSLDLEKIIREDYQVVVPYKVGSVKKIKWKDLNSIEQLTDLGVKKSVAQIILNHRRQNEHTTWEEILALKGIGQTTLSQLKDLIDLS